MTDAGARRILLVEDNTLNRTLVHTILSRSDHPVVQQCTVVDATTLAEARAELRAAPVDLILLDMQLPDGHGLSLAEELAAQPARPITIALTASVLPEQQNTVRAAGCDDFLGKPYRPQQLIDVLVTYLKTTVTRAGEA
jgi:two-component system, OmpR family, KDP operon response regulator KdpE